MDYEEALKIGYRCIHHQAIDALLESSYIDEVARRIADELVKAYEFGYDNGKDSNTNWLGLEGMS